MKPTSTAQILQQLRASLSALKVHAFIVPSEDAHHSEYIAACDNRRAFVSGFTGSAGSALITPTSALMWTDGRYHLQATQQMDDNWTLMSQGLPQVPTQAEWLSNNIPETTAVGFDPWVMSYQVWKQLNQKMRESNRRLVPVTNGNPVDAVWQGRPPRPNNPVRILPESFTGMSWVAKVGLLREKMKEQHARALVVTALDEVAWLFNLRGSDIPHNPVFYAYAVVTLNETHIFLDSEKLNSTPKLREYLSDVVVHPYDKILSFVQSLESSSESETVSGDSTKVWFDVFASHALFSAVSKSIRLVEQSPIAKLKAVKTAEEIAGSKRAHLQDAVALCRYLCWLEEQLSQPQHNLTEYTAAQRLDGMRAEMEDFVSLSFDTISSTGANGAIIHYKPQETIALPLSSQQVYLVDSGGQYVTGTTDVTRTVHYGTPTLEEKQAYTLVLKGHIQLATTIFPKETLGSRLDAFARAAMWRYGLEFQHGTGHGVGAFLNVHEGPCGFSGARSISNLEAGLQPGMLITIEPGFYLVDRFGMRVENVYAVVPATVAEIGSGENAIRGVQGKQFLTFESITITPLQQKMVDIEMLTEIEKSWIDEYHVKCRQLIGPELKKRGLTHVYDWLIRETTPLVAK